jgi:NNP family nitrate/nitrite transporter-like MFS transporter
VITERFHSELAVTSEVDVAVNTPITLRLAYAVLTNPLTWLPSLSYLTTFGFELAIDSNLANILYAIYKSKSFGQTKAGYIASTFGLLNFFTRPTGGLVADLLYRRWGVPGKKYWMLSCGVLQGVLSIGLGFYIDSAKKPDLATIIALTCLVALFNEMANGANFSLVPHTNACQYLPSMDRLEN